MKRITLVLSLLLMAGCVTSPGAGSKWENIYDPHANYLADYRQCRHQIVDNPDSSPDVPTTTIGGAALLVGALALAATNVSLIHSCLEAKGWRERRTSATVSANPQPTIRPVEHAFDCRQACEEMERNGELKRGMTLDQCIETLCK